MLAVYDVMKFWLGYRIILRKDLILLGEEAEEEAEEEVEAEEEEEEEEAVEIEEEDID